MFRGKESSNRIELSRLVQDLLNFGVLGSLRLWGWGWVGVWGWRVIGGCPTHMCTCTRMHTCTRAYGKHDNFMQMAPPLGESLGIPYDVICACAYMCMCVHMCGGHPLTTPTHIHPPHTHQGGTPGINQNSIALELIEIFQFCLKI